MIIARALGVAATLVGLAAWVFFLQAGLVLSHYDAKAHLVVARRVIDSLTPGWRQIGAVWLPLPHLIQLLPTQIDVFYRTGAFASLCSVACFGITAYAMACLVLGATGSRPGAATAAALLALNPNLLYLQSTPMTEPLLLATMSLAVLWLFEWLREDALRTPVPRKVGVALFAAVWTRYESWPVVCAALAAAAYVLWRSGARGQALVRPMTTLAAWPAAAVVIFLVNSRITVGAWFVTGGFYVPDEEYRHRLWRTLVSIWWGTHALSGYVLEIVAVVSAVLVAARALIRKQEAALLVPVTLFAAAVLPIYAFYSGHPYRIRYMVPLVAACALFGGLAVPRRGRAAAAVAVALVASAVIESPPWDPKAPMVVEAQWDRPASLARATVTDCLARDYRGDKILASMGSLAHYMQELSLKGFAIADFVHEGNDAIWKEALATGPAAHTGWMLVEERAEGGDLLAQRIRQDPSFARGMTKVCEGGGVALYKRE